MPPTSREKLNARIQNREAAAARRKASASSSAGKGSPTEPALCAAYDQGRAAVLAASKAAVEAARAYAHENKARRAIAADLRAYVEKPTPRVVEAMALVKAIATPVLVAELKRRGVL